MIKIIAFAFCIVLAFSSSKTIDAAQEGVLIKKPLFFGKGGVVEKPIQTGRTWVALTTDVAIISLKPFNLDEVFNDLITLDNNPVDFKVHTTFKFIKGKTPEFVKKFGTQGGWYKNNLREPLRSFVRNFTKKQKMFSMTTDANVTKQLEDSLTIYIKKLLIKKGIPITVVKSTVGKVMPPAEVIAATIQTAVQKQNVMTQRERVKAEESRKLAEIASANADKAYMKSIGMSPDQYLAMKKLDNEKLAITSARDGKISLNLIMGNVQPMYNIK